MLKLSKGLLISLVILLSACSQGPKVTICLSDPPSGGFQCHDQAEDRDFFLDYKDSEDIVGMPKDDLELLINYWRTKCDQSSLSK